MASKVEVKISGLTEIRANLKMLSEAYERRVLEAGLKKGLVPLRQTARSIISPISTRIAKNISIARWRPEPGLTATAVVRVRKLSKGAIRKFKKETGKKSGRLNPNDPFFWRFWEFGFHDRGGTYHKPVAFLRRAFEAQKFNGVNVAIDAFRSETTKVFKKFRRTTK